MTTVPLPTGTIYPLANKALDGKLAARLSQGRAEGLSFYDLRDELRDQGIAVSHETVRRWCMELEIETERAS